MAPLKSFNIKLILIGDGVSEKQALDVNIWALLFLTRTYQP